MTTIKRRLVAAAALALAACAPPKTPSAPTTQVVTVALAPGVANCSITLASTDAAIPYASTWQQPGLPYAPAVFPAVPWAVQHVKASSANCAGYLDASSTVETAGNGQTAILLALTPSAPVVPPLPPAPSRDQVLHARAIFQGLTVTTKQLGSVPSFGGAETGMLDDPADRQAVYDAIKAAGGNAIVLAVDCHYKESGVRYPNEEACRNDWTDTTKRHPGATPYPATGDTSTIVARVAEAARAGLITLYMQGGDEIMFSDVADQVGPQMAALRAYPGGDLTRWIQLCPGFDSIIPIANEAPYQTSNQTLVDLLLADRAAIGPDGVIALELPNGWAFAGGGALSGDGWFNSPAGQTVNVYLEEFADDDPGVLPTPKIVAGTYDAEHDDYAPTFSPDATSWMQDWQIADRLLPTWREPDDMPTSGKCARGLGPIVPVTGGPSGGGTACVYADRSNPTRYTLGSPSDTVFVAFETATYRWTHGTTTTAAIIANGRYLAGLGYQIVDVPTTAPSGHLTADHRLRPAA